jgi:hypothetical protein
MHTELHTKTVFKLTPEDIMEAIRLKFPKLKLEKLVHSVELKTTAEVRIEEWPETPTTSVEGELLSLSISFDRLNTN